MLELDIINRRKKKPRESMKNRGPLVPTLKNPIKTPS